MNYCKSSIISSNFLTILAPTRRPADPIHSASYLPVAPPAGRRHGVGRFPFRAGSRYAAGDGAATGPQNWAMAFCRTRLENAGLCTPPLLSVWTSR